MCYLQRKSVLVRLLPNADVSLFDRYHTPMCLCSTSTKRRCVLVRPLPNAYVSLFDRYQTPILLAVTGLWGSGKVSLLASKIFSNVVVTSHTSCGFLYLFSVFPLRKFYIEQMFALLHNKHTTTQPCRHTNSQAFPALNGLCDTFIPY